MKRATIASLMFFGVFQFAHAADQCEEFSGYAGNPVAFKTCSHKGGGSGYLVIENLGNRSADICWTVIFNNGKQDRGCHSSMGPGKEEISCYYCGTKHGGIKTVQLTKYAIKP